MTTHQEQRGAGRARTGRRLHCMAGLCLGPGLFVHLELRLNPAFAVLFLRTQNLAHQASLAGLVQHVRAMTWFLAGNARRLFPLTHGQIHLQAGLSA